MDTLSDFFENNLIFINAMKQNWMQKNFSYLSDGRPNHGILLSLSGKINYVCADKIISVEPGDLLFLPKKSRYNALFFAENDTVSDYLVNFEAEQDVSLCDTPRKIENSADCTHLFEQLVQSYCSANKTANYKKGIFYLLLDSIAVKFNRADCVNPIVEEAQILLTDSAGLSIKEIAKKCYTSESNLRKIFKDNLGISPAKYRIDFKIERAKDLIESTTMPIGEISDLLGFYDPAYFCKMFQNKVGTTPKKYLYNKRV